MIRVAIISDPHCGHQTGLTPPCAWGDQGSVLYEFRKTVWEWYQSKLKETGPYDVCIINGDAIDGKAEKNGSIELLTSNLNRQVEWAEMACRATGAKTFGIIRGTKYHTGKQDNWEDILADRLGTTAYSHQWFDFEGVTVDFKHKVGSSKVPYGRTTSVRRAALWNALWAERGLQPKAQVLVRSHVHTYQYSGDGRTLALTTPGLQWMTEYGELECESDIDLGFVSMVFNQGEYEWKAHLMDMQWAAPQSIRL